MSKILSLFLAVTWILVLSFATLPSSSFSLHTVETETEIRTIPEIEDPTPGYWDTSEYMIGSIAVGIILPESDGSIDPSTEDWTDEEIEKVLNEVHISLDFWTSQNPNARVSFVTENHTRIPTSYEPITHIQGEKYLWIGEVMTHLNFPLLPGQEPKHQVWDYGNFIRDKYNTDWAFGIFIVDSSEDEDGLWEGGRGAASAVYGGPYLYMSRDANKQARGIELMDRVVAHETGHVFFARDEYPSQSFYGGYLNVSSIPHSRCIMDRTDNMIDWDPWRISGSPHGENGTWGQVGWRDRENDGIQDIVDTFPRIHLGTQQTIGDTSTFTGVATVTPYKNKNPVTPNKPIEPRDVTINTIEKIEYRIDNGTWLNASVTPTRVQKLSRYPDTYVDKETCAIVDFSLTTPTLEDGDHTIEIQAYNQWGNYGNVTETFTFTGLIGDINGDGAVDIFDVVLAANAFGSTPGDGNWNQAADPNHDNIVDIFDVVLLAQNFGKTT